MKCSFTSVDIPERFNREEAPESLGFYKCKILRDRVGDCNGGMILSFSSPILNDTYPKSYIIQNRIKSLYLVGLSLVDSQHLAPHNAYSFVISIHNY
jgi:hypothetical protein